MRERQDINAFARSLFTGLPDHYDSLAELLSFRQNRRWRRAMVDRVAAADPTSVLDVATGTAGVALLLAERTRAQVIGVDRSYGAPWARERLHAGAKRPGTSAGRPG